MAAPDAAPPLWLDAAGRPSPDAQVALGLLQRADAQGLDPRDYDAEALAAMASRLRAAAPSPAGEATGFERRLNAATVRYLHDLHEGRVDPRTIGFHMAVPDDRHDFPAIVRDAVLRHDLAAVVASYEPQIDQYAALRRELARYRGLAAGPPLELGPPPRGARSVRAGETFADVAPLQRLLVALGDLAPGSVPPGTVLYEGPLVDGVRRFQSRHGLAADGVLGLRTRQAMAVPVANRVRQIELALERLRWLPHLDPGGFVVVNIPIFRLVAWEPAAAGAPPDRRAAPQLAMGVIVGRALDRETPVFADEVEEVIFRPYWNVPASIVRGEVLPAVARHPGYLERHDMEIVDGPGDDARHVATSAQSLALLRDGKLRLRQRPGPANALGLVKLVFPNASNVYLHGTPAPELFQNARRDFSHGCVRVEDPVALAEWALAGEAGWDRARIVAAMNGRGQLRVRLGRPRQVILFYVTAIVRSDDHTIHFADDIYGHDGGLERALAARADARRQLP
ncbi:MAG TPA: L,D-transpeptidase family protein [Thermoanaerobaculia bacterium]|nr:L,D-transpeptidase family protein [Thermoanaerobaculia bacterium]